MFVSTRWNTNANSVAKFVSNSGSNVVANFAGNGDISFYEDTGTTPKLFWDASAEKLGIGNSAPTTTLDVTGSITSQSSAGYATATLKADTSNSGSGGTPELRFELGGTQKARFRVDTSDNVEIATGTGAGSTRFGIASNGDISFYNAAATSQSFFWDASAESLGIGTTSPTAPLHVSGSDSTVAIKIDNTGTGGDTWRIWSTNDAASDGGGKLGFYNEDTATRAMTLDSSGNVGIGTSSPKRLMHLNNAAATTTKIQITNLSTGSASDGDGFQLGISNDGTASIEQRENLDLTFSTNNTERMRIDASGRVGIGGVPNTNWRNDTANQEVLMLGTEATFFSDNVTTELWNNAYVDNSNTFKNISTRGASRYFQYQGAHKWFTAASATAGSTIRPEINDTPKMILDVSGNLGIGGTPTAPLHVFGGRHLGRFFN